jgi:hypothetical protein
MAAAVPKFDLSEFLDFDDLCHPYVSLRLVSDTGVPDPGTYHDARADAFMAAHEVSPALARLGMRNIRCFRALMRRDNSSLTRRPRMALDEAEERLRWYVRLCRPAPLEREDGKLVFPHSFDRTAVRVAAVRPGEWDELGDEPLGRHLAAYRAARRFWAELFALFVPVAPPPPPSCRRCGEPLPPTATGRSSRRAVCRACENAAYYKRLRTRDPEYLRAAWRASKRRIRQEA